MHQLGFNLVKMVHWLIGWFQIKKKKAGMLMEYCITV